jgi:hypothetical protein
MSVLWVKDPLDTCWFEFDWSSFLAADETITSYTTSVNSNLVKLSDSATDTAVSVQVSGGSGESGRITCNIQTSASNTYEVEKPVLIRTRQP